MIFVNIMPSIFARKGHRGQQLLYKAFGEYFDNGHYIQNSTLTKARFEAGVKNGVDNTNIARLEVGSMIGLLVNTILSAFWMFIHVFSDPFLLRDLRNEKRSANVSVAQDERTGKTTKFLDVTSMKQRCTLLYQRLKKSFACIVLVLLCKLFSAIPFSTINTFLERILLFKSQHWSYTSYLQHEATVRMSFNRGGFLSSKIGSMIR